MSLNIESKSTILILIPLLPFDVACLLLVSELVYATQITNSLLHFLLYISKVKFWFSFSHHVFLRFDNKQTSLNIVSSKHTDIIEYLNLDMHMNIMKVLQGWYNFIEWRDGLTARFLQETHLLALSQMFFLSIMLFSACNNLHSAANNAQLNSKLIKPFLIFKVRINTRTLYNFGLFCLHLSLCSVSSQF